LKALLHRMSVRDAVVVDHNINIARDKPQHMQHVFEIHIPTSIHTSPLKLLTFRLCLNKTSYSNKTSKL
jgi:hypothetical protein